jgi:hypothetical protein
MSSRSSSISKSASYKRSRKPNDSIQLPSMLSKQLLQNILDPENNDHTIQYLQ